MASTTTPTAPGTEGFSNQVNQLTPNAVGEFKVVTANASAEYGRSSGAVINKDLVNFEHDWLRLIDEEDGY